MDLFAFPPIAAALDVAHTLLTSLAGALASIAPGWSAALSVVIATLAVRTLLIPLGVRQLRAQLARARLAPLLAGLQKRHRRNPERLQRETLALYRREGVSPLAGIAPALAQAPIVGLLYGVFVLPAVNGHPNALLAESLLGVGLGDSFLVVLGSSAVWPQLLVGLALLVMLAATAWFARRQMLRTMPAPADARAASMARLGASLSFLTVAIGAFVPLAAALYLTVSTAWSVGERAIVRRVLTRAA